MNYPDIFFTPEYARLFEDTAFGGVIESRYVRQIPGSTYVDATMPYGYTGISEPVCEFARLHPFLEHDCDPQYIKQVGEVVYIDLTDSLQVIWKGYDKGCRSSIKKARRAGITISNTGLRSVYAVVNLEGMLNIRRFHDLYIQTMQRNEASQDYMFPFYFFYSAVHLLKGHIKLFTAEYEGAIIAGALILHYGDFVHYFLAGSDVRYLNLCPNNLLLDTVITWAKTEGYKIFNLGGGLGGSNDRLFSFKRSFSHKTKPFSIYFKVNDQKRYNELCRQRGIDPESGGYFPAYRR